MKKFNLIFAAVSMFAAFNVFGQTTPVQTMPTMPTQTTPVSLDNILSEAQKQSENYRETFRNLLADEVKTFEEFDKRGEPERRTTVRSSFLVYQSGKNQTATAELRNVLEVNGKLIPDSQKRGE